MNKIKKSLFGLILALLIIPLFSVTTFATTRTTVDLITGEIEELEVESEVGIEDTGALEIVESTGIPPVSMEEMTDLIEDRTYDIVNLLQIFVRPFSVICFIACAIMTLFGAFGHGGYVSKGLIGMFIAGMMYTAVMYAPQLVQLFSNWLIE